MHLKMVFRWYWSRGVVEFETMLVRLCAQGHKKDSSFVTEINMCKRFRSRSNEKRRECDVISERHIQLMFSSGSQINICFKVIWVAFQRNFLHSMCSRQTFSMCYSLINWCKCSNMNTNEINVHPLFHQKKVGSYYTITGERCTKTLQEYETALMSQY